MCGAAVCELKHVHVWGCLSVSEGDHMCVVWEKPVFQLFDGMGWRVGMCFR